MKVLFDTHMFLWFLEGNKSLSAHAAAVITNPDNALFFSAASYWEICIKISLKKLGLKKSWERIIEEVLLDNIIKWMNIKKEHMENIITLPWHHRDPFDRILIAQANVEKCTLLTSDENIRKYDLDTIY